MVRLKGAYCIPQSHNSANADVEAVSVHLLREGRDAEMDTQRDSGVRILYWFPATTSREEQALEVPISSKINGDHQIHLA